MNLFNCNSRPYSKDQLRTLILSQKLIEAAQNGRLDAVSQLVERHSTPVNYQNCNEGTTALGAAVISGYSNIVKYLVEHGADVNLANLRGETPLHLAVLGSDNGVDIISFLLNEGSWIEIEDECGDTPLMYATREEIPQAVEVLLMHGADADHPNEDDETPAMLAEEIASESVRDLFATYAGREVSNAAAAMVPDGNASGALGTSFEMKVHFPLSKGIMRADAMMTDDSDSTSGSSSGAEDAASLHQSGGYVHSPPLASAKISSSSKNFLGGTSWHVPTVLTAGVDRSRHAFMQSY